MTQAIRGPSIGGINSGTAATANKPANGSLDHPGPLLGMSIVDAVKALLASKRPPLKNPELAAMFKAGRPSYELKGARKHHWFGPDPSYGGGR